MNSKTRPAPIAIDALLQAPRLLVRATLRVLVRELDARLARRLMTR